MLNSQERMFAEWKYDIKMLLSGRMWRNFLLVFGIPLGILAAVFMITATPRDAAIVFFGGFVLFGAIWTIAGVVIDLAGGFRAYYALTNEGIHFAMGKGAQDIAAKVTLVGALIGKPGMMASGMLAKAEQRAFAAWPDITRINVSPSSHYIEIRRKHAIKPIGIYCTAEDFGPILEVIRVNLPQGTPGL